MRRSSLLALFSLILVGFAPTAWAQSISSVSPNPFPATPSGITLTISGGGFTPGGTVGYSNTVYVSGYFGTSGFTPNVQSDSQMQIGLPPYITNNVGSYSLYVYQTRTYQYTYSCGFLGLGTCVGYNTYNYFSNSVSFGVSGTASVSLTVERTSPNVGQTNLLTATVTGSSPTPTGTVQFYEYPGNFVVAYPATVTNGVAMVNARTDGSYNRQYYAVYSGDSTHPSAQSPLSQAVLPNLVRGRVAAWGAGGRLELSNPTPTNAVNAYTVNGLSNVQSVAVGDGFTVALRTDGTVWTWGTNVSGALGVGNSTTSFATATPVQVPNLTNVYAIAVGYHHVLALRNGGTPALWSWGANDYGQGGVGYTSGPLFTPNPVYNLPSNKIWVGVAAGYYHSALLASDGTVYAWGFSQNGQVGVGGGGVYTTPVGPLNMPFVKAIASGWHHMLALDGNGRVWSWGYNGYGALGTGNFGTLYTPAATNIFATAIAAGQFHSVALQSNGTVQTWGYGYEGQLGNGTSTAVASPVSFLTSQGGPITNAIQVAANGVVTSVLRSDGTIWTAGNNQFASVGNNLPGNFSFVGAQNLSPKSFVQLWNSGGGFQGAAIFPDSTGPTLTLPSDITLEATGPAGASTTFTATALDDLDGPRTVTCTPPSGSTFPIGTTTVNCTASDTSFNTSHGTFQVIVQDTTRPDVTLLGADPMTVSAGSAFADPGATATDLVDGDLTPYVVVTGAVDTNVVGTYVVSYTATDHAGNSGQVTRVVNVIAPATTTALASSLNPSTVGSPVTFTAVVNGLGIPTGTVTFTDGASSLGTAPLLGGAATFTTAALSPGSHSITAIYGGDATFLPSTSLPLTQVVNKIVSTTTLTSSANPSVVGQPVTLTASVAPPAGSGIITGQINHWSLNEAAGSASAADPVGNNTAQCGAAVVVAGQTADCPTFGTPGPHGTAATFDGTNDFLRVNNSVAGTFTASAWIRTTQWGNGVEGDHAFIGQGIIWSDVGGAHNDIIPMALVSDKVAFGTGENGLPYQTITSSIPVNTGNWVHVVVTRDAATGAKQLFINGDIDQVGDGSTGLLSANGVVAIGANPLDQRYFNGDIDDVQIFNRVLTWAEVHALYANGPSDSGPMGSVTFSDGATTLGTATLVGGSATLVTSNLALGSHEVAVSYGGDERFDGSAASLTQTVNQASTTTAVNSSGTLRYGSMNMALLATVTAVSPATGVPTGTVTFFDGTTDIGTATLVQLTSNSARATLPLPPTTNAGTHAYRATYGGDDSFTGSTRVSNRTLAKALLTLLTDSKTKVYGDANPPLTAHYTGFVNGDTDAVIDTPPVLNTAATQASHVGSYTITVSALPFDNNYTFSVGAAGTLSISPAALTITADDKSKVYGAAVPDLTVSYSGFANGDTPAELTTAPAVSTTATQSSNAGTYPITASGAADIDYTFSYVDGTLTVTKASLAVQAIDASRPYGDPNPSFGVTYTGFANGETLETSGVSGQPDVTTTADATSPVGDYPITAALGSLAASNYDFTFSGGTLTVVPRHATVTADAKSKTYGDADPALTHQITSGTLANGDTFSGALARDPGENVGTYAIGQGTLALSGNYALSYVGANLVITHAALTITANNASREFGTANPPLTASYAGLVNGDDPDALDTPVTLATSATPTSAPGTYAITASGAADANYAISFVNGVLTVTDTTRPTLNLPSNITTDATSPSGVVVTFTATAVDAVDGTLAVTCTPASGSTFAVGDTTVSCSATDAHGNTASGSFMVHVNSAAEMTQTLTATVTAAGMQQSGNLLTSVLQYANNPGSGNKNVACNNLNAFTHQVRANKKLSPAQQADLLTETTNIAATLSCQ